MEEKDTNTGHVENGFHRIRRLLLMVGSFVLSYFMVSRVMILFGAIQIEANASGLICGLAVMAFVMYHPRRT